MKRLVLLVAACRGADAPKPTTTTVAQADPCAIGEAEGPITWIHDDYPRALACARQKKLPLVLDLWAPWCHTCLSMQSTVFMDASFAAARTKFVFASLDTDKESNARALGKLSISAWPTFYVLGDDESVLAHWVGAESTAQFHEFLDAGDHALAGGKAAGDAHLLSAQRALAVKDLATADTELEAAYKATPRGEVLNDWILTKWKRKDVDGCLALAEQDMGATGNTSVASDFNVTAMACAEAAAKDKPERVKALREKAVARWKELLADGSSPMSADDRSDAMASERETLEALGRKDEAKKVAEAQLAMLDAAAAKATTPMAAMTYNWPRSEVYVYLGRALELVPALEKSAKDLPKEYDPRARLGWLYYKAGKQDLAAKWTDQALELVYGPRRARLLGQRADIAKAAGDATTERTYREQAVQAWQNLPPEQASPENLERAKQALEACGTSH